MADYQCSILNPFTSFFDYKAANVNFIDNYCNAMTTSYTLRPIGRMYDASLKQAYITLQC